jgi:hypothetical protein
MTELEQLRKEVNELRERLAKLEAAPRSVAVHQVDWPRQWPPQWVHNPIPDYNKVTC